MSAHLEISTSKDAANGFSPPSISKRPTAETKAGHDSPDEGHDNDALDMRRLGRQQELKRVLRPIGLFFWFCVSQALWPFLTLSIDAALIDGGRAGLFWLFLAHTLFAFPLALSITELVSLAPTAGALYHWVAEFAPENIQKPLSYIVGWCNLLSYLAGTSSGLLLNGILIQSLISIVNPSATLAQNRWPVILFVTIESLCGLLINIWGFKIVPSLQWVLFMVFVAAGLLIIVSISIGIQPKATAHEVFLDFSNFANWDGIPLAVFVGQITPISYVIGYDVMAHVIEETQDASKTIRWAAPISYIFNSIFNLAMVLVFTFALPSVETGLDSKSNLGYAFIYILRQLPWLSLQIIIITLLSITILGSNINYTMSVSREVYAFARGKRKPRPLYYVLFVTKLIRPLDFGLPYSKFLSRVDSRRKLPTIAIIWSTFWAYILCLIYLGNITAYYAISSLSCLGLLFCYICAIGSRLWWRMSSANSRQVLEQAKYAPSAKKPFLGENIMRLCNMQVLPYVAWCIFWVPWPLYPNPDAETMNWSLVVFVIVLIVSVIWYFWQGRQNYRSPREILRD